MRRYCDLSLQGTALNRRHTFGKSERFKNVVDPLKNRNSDIYSRWLHILGILASKTIANMLYLFSSAISVDRLQRAVIII